MTLPFDKLEVLRRRLLWRMRGGLVLQLLLWSGVLWAGLGYIDYFWRFELPAVRWGLSSLLWGGQLSLLGFYGWHLWQCRVNLVDVVFALDNGESHETTEELAGAMSLHLAEAGVGGTATPHPTFVSGKTSQFGSWSEALLERITQRHAMRPGKVRWWPLVLQAIFVGGGACLVWGTTGDLLKIAVERLTRPGSSSSWPLQTRLVIYDRNNSPINPGAVLSVLGNDQAEFTVRDRVGPPPRDVTLEIRRNEQAVRRIRLSPDAPLERVTASDSAGGKTTPVAQPRFRFRLSPTAAEPVHFRVVGGDDRRMPWTTLRREVRPGLQEIRCQLTPPTYLGLPEVTLTNWVGPLRVPTGSQLDFDVRLNRPASRFELRHPDGKVLLSGGLQQDRIAFRLEPDQLHEVHDQLSLFVKTHTADEQLFANSASPAPRSTALTVPTVGEDSSWQRVRRIALEVMPDLPPEIHIDLPVDEQTVTSRAVVPWQLSATDDHHIQKISLSMLRASEIYELPLEMAESSERREVSIGGVLALEVFDFHPGESVRLRGGVVDAYPEREQTLSAEVTLRIVSDLDKEQELQQLLRLIAEELLKSYELQRAALSDSSSLREQLQQARDKQNLSEAVRVTALRAMRQKQLQLQVVLQSRLQGGLISRLRQEVEQNRLTQQTLTAVTAQLETDLNELVTGPVTTLPVDLANLLMITGTPLEESQILQRLETEVRTIAVNQQEILGKLAELLSRLEQWSERTDLRMQWHLAQGELEQLIPLLTDQIPESLSKTWEALSAQQKQELQTLAQRHRNLEKKLRTFTEQLQTAPVDEWQALHQALTELRPTEQLRAAGDAILRNNLLRAVELDQRLLKEFQELNSRSASPTMLAPERLLSRLEGLAENLARLTAQQLELQTEWNQEPLSPDLHARQQEVQQELADVLGELEQFQLAEAAAPLSRAIRLSEELLETGQQLNQEARNDILDRLRAALDESRKQLEAGVQQLQQRDQLRVLADLADVSRTLLIEHRTAFERYLAIAASSDGEGRISRSARRQLLDLGKQQLHFREELAEFSERLSKLPVIQEAVEQLLDLHAQLGSELSQGETHSRVESGYAEIARQLAQLGELNQLDESPPDVPGGPDTPEAAMPGLSPQLQAQLLFLKIRQQTLVTRSRELLSRPDPPSQAELQSLREEQAAIMTTIEQLLETWDAESEDSDSR